MDFPYIAIDYNMVLKDYNKLLTITNKLNVICGSKIMDYYFQVERYNTKGFKGHSHFDYWTNPTTKAVHIERMKKLNLDPSKPAHIRKLLRFNLGCITYFRPCWADYIYNTYNSNIILDPCMGWGGRLLGAKGRLYYGFDSNTNLINPYYQMISDLDIKNTYLTFKPFEEVEENTLDKIKYDTVLTCPPYIYRNSNRQTEKYNNMPDYNKKTYYTDFLIPMLTKCYKHLVNSGVMCIILPKYIYNEATDKYGFDKCDETINLKSIKRFNSDVNEMCYVWKKC